MQHTKSLQAEKSFSRASLLSFTFRESYYRDNNPTPMTELIAEYVEARLDEYLEILSR